MHDRGIGICQAMDGSEMDRLVDGVFCRADEARFGAIAIEVKV